MKYNLTALRPILVLLLIFSLLLGGLYPSLTLLLGRALFPKQAAGSLVIQDEVTQGSILIGQPFTQAKYFWPRPSATPERPYNASASGASNLAVTNPLFRETVAARVARQRDANPYAHAPVPIDLVTASASGLDPDISLAAAYFQAPRVARARKWREEKVNAIIQKVVAGRQFGILGEPSVNVLRLNLALDDAAP